jgi:peptidyl-prolyl cis-trans isomerase A (cyclophilin A)
MSPLRLLPLLALSFLSACGGGGDDAGTTPPVIPPAPYLTCSDAGKAASATSAVNTVCMLTTQGEIVIELYAAYSPITVANFLKYVNAKLYDNTLYHRVAKNFVIQGGGFSTSGAAIATYAPIALESNNGLSNIRGTIAMARTSAPASATSQFFFNTVDNSACLNYGTTTCSDTNGYAVFGKIIAGLDVMDKIAAVATNTAEQPLQPVVTYWATQLK